MLFRSTMRVDQEWAPVGIIRQVTPLFIETRNVLQTGDSIEYMGRNLETIPCEVTSMTLEDGTSLERANPGQRVELQTDPPINKPEKHCLFRKNMKG